MITLNKIPSFFKIIFKKPNIIKNIICRFINKIYTPSIIQLYHVLLEKVLKNITYSNASAMSLFFNANFN